MIERATAKDPRARYASMADFVRDLEEVLTYESARSGGATGEATAILSQLPQAASRRRTRRRRIVLAVAYVAIAAAVAVAGGAADQRRGQAERAAGAGRPQRDPAR